MKRLIWASFVALVAAFASGCETTSARQSERAEVYASYRPTTDDVEISVRYAVYSK